MSTRIVVVGGGVAGLELATRLAKRHDLRKSAKITLVDRGLSHFWKPMLHTFAAGTERSERQKIDFLAHAKTSGFAFWPGLLIGVDRKTKEVLLAPDLEEAPFLDAAASNRLPYDILILAIGSQANDFGTPGVAGNCLTIDDLAGAERFRRALRRELLGSVVKRDVLRIAIVGGGPTGVELAAELKQAMDLIAGYGDGELAPKLELILIDHSPRLLATFPENVSEAATELLRGLGVDVRTGTGVVAADESGFTLQNGDKIMARLRVWAAGVKAPEVLAGIAGLETSHTGQIIVDASLRARGDPTILVLGDAAFVADAPGGRGLPGTAQVAHQQARHLARHLQPRQPEQLPPFRYRDQGSLVALADYGGWGTIGRHAFGGRRLEGFVARLGHSALYRQHQLSLYGPARCAVAVLVDRLDRVVAPEVRLDA